MIKKNKIKIITLILVVFLIILLGWKYLTPKGSIEDISDLDFFNNHLDNEFVYFGRPTCPHCVLLYPRLEKVAKNSNVTIHYINTDEYREEEKLQEILNTYEINYVPYLAKFENGKIVKVFNNREEGNNKRTIENLKVFLK